MKATVGDVVVAAGAGHDHSTRNGTVVKVLGPDGAPPFMVRWSDTGDETFYFPDPSAVVEHQLSDPDRIVRRPSGSLTTKRWEVVIYLAGSETETTAHTVLHTSAEHALEARGGALHPAEDDGVNEIGEEIATARALHQLADLLGSTARHDLLRSGPSSPSEDSAQRS